LRCPEAPQQNRPAVVDDFDGDSLADILCEGRDSSAILSEINAPQMIASAPVDVAGSGLIGPASDAITVRGELKLQIATVLGVISALGEYRSDVGRNHEEG
jgi:hypothetical protein